MQAQTLYDDPALYDRLVPPGPCEAFYDGLVGPDAVVLELACGTGRLTIPLARSGRRVTGLDASPAMLAAARRKGAAEGVHVEWRRSDMADFDLPQRFDLIVISCNSLGHLTTHEAVSNCLDAVRRHLGPGGVLAFDVVNPDDRILHRPEKSRVRRAPPASGLKLRESARYDPRSRVRHSAWRVHDQDGSVREVQFELRQFRPDELSSLLSASGLNLLERFGCFSRSRFSARSRLQVCLAGAV